VNVSTLYRQNLRQLGAGDVVVASYGGSGQALVGNILAELGLNYVDPYTETLAADGTANHASEHLDYRSRLAGLHRRDNASGAAAAIRPWPRFVKSHHLPHVFDGCALGGVWLLVRDPRDALYSWYQWRLRFADESWDQVDGDFDDFLGRPDSTGRRPVEDWCSFYAGWSARATCVKRTTVMRFEDLKERPFETTDGALRRFGVRAPEARLRRAIANSTFEAMRKHEDGVAASLPARREARVMRAGKVAGWRDWITPQLARHFASDDLRSLAARLGYAVEEVRA
jgi:hypothetical protein